VQTFKMRSSNLFRGLSEAQREERLVVETAAQLPPATRAALDALVKTQEPEKPADEDQLPLFPFFRFAMNSPR
jgi:hypothetical protein